MNNSIKLILCTVALSTTFLLAACNEKSDTKGKQAGATTQQINDNAQNKTPAPKTGDTTTH